MAALVLAGWLPAGSGWADQQLAADKGCYGCHGEPPKKGAPTFAQLAQRYVKHQTNAARLHELADKLREGSIFGHVNAHERLDHETAERLVTWIAAGAP